MVAIQDEEQTSAVVEGAHLSEEALENPLEVPQPVDDVVQEQDEADEEEEPEVAPQLTSITEEVEHRALVEEQVPALEEPQDEEEK